MKRNILILSGLMMGITAVITLIFLNNRPPAAIQPQNLALAAQPSDTPVDNEVWAAISRGEQQLLDSSGNPIPMNNPGFDWQYHERNRNPLRVAGLKGARAGREEMMHFMRSYPADTIPLTARLDAYNLYEAQLAQLSPQQSRTFAANVWQQLGPDPITGEQMGELAIDASGRVTAVAVHPTNPNIVYIGAAQGGIWKTTDGGNSFVPLTDAQASLAVGTIALDPSNPNTIYVGTGEPHGSDSYYGLGILKSTNGGQSWQLLGSNTFVGLAFANIVVNPSNPNLVYAAAGFTKTDENHPQTGTPGIYRSTNGGQSWELLASACGTNGCASSSALVMPSNNPNTLYAAFDGYGIYKSTDGGANWDQSFGLSVAHDRIEVAISPSNPAVLYAGFEVYRQDGSSFGAVFKSNNSGQSWSQLNSLQYSYCGEQCGYDNILAVHPTNPNIVLAGGQAVYSGNVPGVDGTVFRTDDGGNSWSFNSGINEATTVHPDLHAIAFAPSNPNIVWIGNDGGAYKSSDGGHTWQVRNNDLATLQFQSVALHPTDPNVFFGGMQDNSKTKTTNSGQSWVGLDAGDGGFTAIDPFDPRYWYGTRFSSRGQYMQFQRNDQSGTPNADDWPVLANGIDVNDRVLFYAPLLTDPNTAGRVYWGTHRLYRSNNRGDNWTAISPDLTKGYAISAINVLKGNSNYIMTGSADGLVALTKNGGSNWFDITSAPLPNRWVADVVMVNEQLFYVAFSGFAANTPGTPGHVFRSNDGGNSWVDISHTGQNNGLPDIPVLALAVDPDDANVVYAGTDFGVYQTTNGGQNWVPFNQNLPLVAIFDLAIHKYPNGAKQLVAATHGRSLWKLPLGSTQPPGDQAVYLPYIGKRAPFDPQPQPTAVPTSSAPTATPTQPPNATATPQPTPTFTPTPGSNNLPEVPNGDFEQGQNGDWFEDSLNGEPLIVNNGLPINAHSGSWVAWLGGLDDEISSLSQSFFLTDVTGPLYLKFYYQIRSDDECGFDFVYVLLDGNTVLQSDLCSSEETNSWQAASVDLADFVGSSVTVEFLVTTDSSVSSSFFIDDVAFAASP